MIPERDRILQREGWSDLEIGLLDLSTDLSAMVRKAREAAETLPSPYKETMLKVLEWKK